MRKIWVSLFHCFSSLILYISLEYCFKLIGLTSYSSPIHLFLTRAFYLCLTLATINVCSIFMEGNKVSINQVLGINWKHIPKLLLSAFIGASIIFSLISWILICEEKALNSLFQVEKMFQNRVWLFSWLLHSLFEELNKFYWFNILLEDNKRHTSLFLSSILFSTWHITNRGISMLALINLFLLVSFLPFFALNFVFLTFYKVKFEHSSFLNL